jgi:hypothetical protein
MARGASQRHLSRPHYLRGFECLVSHERSGAKGHGVRQRLSGIGGGSRALPKAYRLLVPPVAQIGSAHNNALHLTKGAWSGPSISLEGRSLRAPFAGERGCWTDARGSRAYGARLVAALGSLQLACGPEVSPPPPKAVLPQPATSICIDPPAPPAVPISDTSNARACVSDRGLPLEVTVSLGKVVAFRFYSQCSGQEHSASPSVAECVGKAVASWRFEVPPSACPADSVRVPDRQVRFFFLEPPGEKSDAEEVASCG